MAASYAGMEVIIVHTGQHYDEKMAGIFFKQFNLAPDHIIELEHASPVKQVGEIMIRLSELLETIDPHWVMCVGDVNSTLATALVANKMNLSVFHLESGLRSFDKAMPEEWNRLVTDRLCEKLFVTEQSGIENLLHEHTEETKIHFVGNTMIDTLVAFETDIEAAGILEKLNVSTGAYILLTLHRPSNVDTAEGLQKLIGLMKDLPAEYKIVFPVHPRTWKQLQLNGQDGDLQALDNVIITEPLDYFAFQKLIKHSVVVITDSGGIQEESTFRQVPCLTLRENTERPSTIIQGTNTLVAFDSHIILKHVRDIKEGRYKKGTIPQLWDGHATERILSIIAATE